MNSVGFLKQETDQNSLYNLPVRDSLWAKCEKHPLHNTHRHWGHGLSFD